MRKTRVALLMIVFTLIVIGIVMIYSSTAIYAWQKYNDSAYFLKRHLFFILIGILCAALVMSFDYHILSKYAKLLVLVSLLFLVLLQIPGVSREIAGAKRWFRLLGLSFQPSEFANLAVIIYAASFLSRKGLVRMEQFSFGFLPVIAVLGMVNLLVLIQPDLGTVVALSVVVFIMLFIAGARFRYLTYIFLSALPFLYLLIFNVPYRRVRIMAFLNPWADSLGSGFQLIQSQVALGRGGIFGRGLGKSLQKLFYLPAAHTDFIFSILGEELGFFATAAVAGLFILLFLYGCKIVKSARDTFGAFLSLGIISLLSLKAILNIGVSIGLFPTKGLPLPFISYGGSSLLVDMISFGLLLNVARFAVEP